MGFIDVLRDSSGEVLKNLSGTDNSSEHLVSRGMLLYNLALSNFLTPPALSECPRTREALCLHWHQIAVVSEADLSP